MPNISFENTKISACLIVKNEEKYLIECLRSIYHIVDEIVIVDTGSADRTLDIIVDCSRKEGVKKIKLYQLPWSGDFADMRNKSLNLASKDSDYILVIDGDEILDNTYTKDGPIGFRRKLDLRPAPNNNRALFFCHRHYTEVASIIDFEPCKNPDSKYEKGLPGYFHTFCVRLFPNKPEIAYQGIVHELVEYKVFDAGITPQHIDPAIILHHYGNLNRARKDKNKSEHYIKLLNQKMKDMPNNWRTYFELGNEWMQQGLYENAETAYRQALDLKQNQNHRWSKDISEHDQKLNEYRLTKLIIMNLVKIGTETAYRNVLPWLNAGFNMAPRDPDLFVFAGITYHKGSKNFLNAIWHLEKALSYNPKHLIAMHAMAQVFEESGKRTEAIMWYEKMLEQVPGLISIRQKIQEILNKR